MLAAHAQVDICDDWSDEESGLLLSKDLSAQGTPSPTKPPPKPTATDDDLQKTKFSLIDWQKILLTTLHACTVLFVFCITVAIMGVCMQFFPAGVLCVLLFSLLTCSCMPVMNITLYASALWLLIQGWTLTNQGLSLVWHTPL